MISQDVIQNFTHCPACQIPVLPSSDSKFRDICSERPEGISCPIQFQRWKIKSKTIAIFARTSQFLVSIYFADADNDFSIFINRFNNKKEIGLTFPIFPLSLQDFSNSFTLDNKLNLLLTFQ